jgi:hypothetical protein
VHTAVIQANIGNPQSRCGAFGDAKTATAVGRNLAPVASVLQGCHIAQIADCIIGPVPVSVVYVTNRVPAVVHFPDQAMDTVRLVINVDLQVTVAGIGPKYIAWLQPWPLDAGSKNAGFKVNYQ